MMRSLMVLGALGVVGFMAGWFTINRDDGRTTIEINRDEIRSDARQAVDRGKEYWEQRQQQQAAAQQNASGQPSPWNQQPAPWDQQAAPWDQQAGTYQPAPMPGPYGAGQPQYPQANGYEAPTYNQPTGYNQPAGYAQPPAAGNSPWNQTPPPANWQAIPAGYQNGQPNVR